MQAFLVWVDWTAHDAYGDKVTVELRMVGDGPKIIHLDDDPEKAVNWAVKWFKDRGIRYWCDIDMHQRLGHKYICIKPAPEVVEIPEVELPAGDT